MKERRFKLCLQLFDEGFAGGDAGGAEGSLDGPASHESLEEPEVVYGIQQDDDSEVPVDVTEGDSAGVADDAGDYNNFRTKYKAEIGKEIQDAVSKRFKNQADANAQLQSLNDGLAPLYAKYGLNAGDSEALIKAIAEDNALIDDLAEQNGMTNEAYRRFAQSERENARFKEQQSRAEVAAKAKADYDNWIAQGEELKAIYPNFDLRAEMSNPDFIADIRAGKSVRKAFEAAHLDEILSGAVQATAANVRKAVTDSIAARGMRPAENGTKARPGVVVKDDVNKLTDQDIDQIIRRVNRGEKIRF